MSPPLEILVHVSGPSRGADDARYRREALGLLAFQPANRHDLSGNNANGKEFQHLPSGPTQRTSAVRNLFEAKLQDLTPYRNVITKASVAPNQTETIVKDTPRLLIDRTPGLPRSRTAPSVHTPSQTIRPLRRTQSDSWQTPPSVILDSQPIGSSDTGLQIASSPNLKRPFQSSSPSPTRCSSPSPKRPKIRSDALVDMPMSSSPILATVSPRRSILPLNTTSPFEIHPPPPSPGVRSFTTHLTPGLKTLSEKLLLTEYFKPLSVKRDLEKSERGHWHIPLATWDNTIKIKFWQFLHDFITGGRAGFGVRCFRETLARDPATDSHALNSDSINSEVAKVYCWGEVVGEVYLLLWLASNRKVKSVGSRWLDAGGEVIVRMR